MTTQPNPEPADSCSEPLPEPESVAVAPQVEPAARLSDHHLLHRLWTKAVGTPGYDKQDWIELEHRLRTLIRPEPSSPSVAWTSVFSYGPGCVEMVPRLEAEAKLADLAPTQPLGTRFKDFYDADHPCNVWWRKHGQYMMSGGGERQFIWACRGWIAREQFAAGVDVTGESLNESEATQPQPSAEIEFSDKRCSRCGAKRLTSGVCSLIGDSDGRGGCPDPTYDYYAEKATKSSPPSEELVRRIAEQAGDFPPTWERIGALHKRVGQLEELLKVHVKKIRNQKTEIKRLQMLHEKASIEIERLKVSRD